MNNIYVDAVNSVMYKAQDLKDLYLRLDKFFEIEYDSYFYSVILLDNNDNNFYIEHSTMPSFKKIHSVLYPLFENKILRRLYGFGELKGFREDEDDYITIGGNISEISTARIIEYDRRIIGFLLFHDKKFFENETELKYLITQLANSIVIFKRFESEHNVNLGFASNMKILKFLSKLMKETSIEVIFHKLLNHIYDMIEAEAGCVAYKNEDGEWETPAEIGLNESILKMINFKDGMNILDFMQHVQQIYNIDEDTIKNQIDFSEIRVNLRSLFLIPIVDNGECGSIVVLANYHKRISEKKIIYLQKLSYISATALQNYALIADKDSSYPEKEMKLTALRNKFIETLETLLDEIEI